jgi:hypothetical protein
MFSFEFMQGSICPTSPLGVTAKRLVDRFNRVKQAKRRPVRELTPDELHHLREVTLRETPAEVVERRWEIIKRNAELIDL